MAKRRNRVKALTKEGRSIDEIVVQLIAEGWPEATPDIVKKDRDRE